MDAKKFRFAILLSFGTISFGTLGYYFFEGMTFFDAFYMTIITVSTVGFSEIKPLTTIGRSITMVVIMMGIGVGGYTIGMVARSFIEGELRIFFGRKKLEKRIAALAHHFIICGYGRIGRIISSELADDKIPFVVIEQDAKAVEQLQKNSYLWLQMDATSEEALLAAGIKRAKGLVTALPSDAHNVFITLTAKGLRPDIFILSRASDHGNEDKLKRAGATRVVSPYLIGGRRMAQVLKRPTVVDFIDIAMMESNLGLMMEEAKIGPESQLIGKNIMASNLRRDFGVIVVAIKKMSDEMIFNPGPGETLEAGDVIVVLGKMEHLERMRAVL
ncbi:MAG: potassium channel protein [Desulfobacterales bacterium]|nr:potassium channel protein [Desulfobacterales bacterium]